MNQASQEPTSTPRRAVRRDRQPTVAQLARLGIKVRDFGYENTLPPVRTVPRRQPQQIQPGVVRFPRQENQKETQHQRQSQGGRQPLVRVDTEPFLGVEAGPAPSIPRELGGFFQIDEPVHSGSPGNFQPPVSFPPQQEPGSLIPTPTVTPNGSLQWREPEITSERDGLPPQMPSHHTTFPGLSLAAPFTPLPTSAAAASAPVPPRPDVIVLSTRSPSKASLEGPSAKRRKI